MAARAQAIIYVPHDHGDDVLRWLDICIRHCTSRGYGVAAIVHDDRGGKRWADVISMVADDSAQVIVVARADHLPPGRVEVAAERPAFGGRRPMFRRTSGDHGPPPASGPR